MREILFRGQKIGSKEWAYGFYTQQVGRGINGCKDEVLHFIQDKYGTHLVILETVGQFIGLTDKNGVRIFEGDKFNTDDDDGSYLLIAYNNEKAKFSVCLYSYLMWFNEGGGEEWGCEIELLDDDFMEIDDIIYSDIIGNIHDNTELAPIKSS